VTGVFQETEPAEGIVEEAEELGGAVE